MPGAYTGSTRASDKDCHLSLVPTSNFTLFHPLFFPPFHFHFYHSSFLHYAPFISLSSTIYRFLVIFFVNSFFCFFSHSTNCNRNPTITTVSLSFTLLNFFLFPLFPDSIVHRVHPTRVFSQVLTRVYICPFSRKHTTKDCSIARGSSIFTAAAIFFPEKRRTEGGHYIFRTNKRRHSSKRLLEAREKHERRREINFDAVSPLPRFLRS